MQQINRNLVVRAMKFVAFRRILLPLCIATLTVGAVSGTAQTNQTTIAFDGSFYAVGPRLKLDNGYLVAWAPNSDVSPDIQVKAFDQQGAESASLNLLQSLPGAKKVVISDVSVSFTGMVAVGAQVFTDKHKSKLELLVLDSVGQLYKSIEFDHGLGVSKVEIDDDGNIWVLRMGAGMSDPAKVPVLAEYDGEGNALGEFLHFSDFTKDAQILHGGFALGGDVQMGVSQAGVWFWLPSTRELVTLLPDGSGLQRVTTSLPPWPGAKPSGAIERAQRCGWSSSQGLVCEVAFLASPSAGVTAQSALYKFSTEAQQWASMPLGAAANHAGMLLGVDQDNAVFISFDQTEHSVTIDSVPLSHE